MKLGIHWGVRHIPIVESVWDQSAPLVAIFGDFWNPRETHKKMNSALSRVVEPQRIWFGHGIDIDKVPYVSQCSVFFVHLEND